MTTLQWDFIAGACIGLIVNLVAWAWVRIRHGREVT